MKDKMANQYQQDDDTSWVEELSKKKELEKLQMQGTEVSLPITYGKYRSSRCFKILVVFLICAAAAAIVLAVKLFNVNKQDDLHLQPREMELGSGCDDSVCTSPACVKAAAYILNGIDPAIDPCEDFYEFACGGWMRSRELPPDTGNYALYSELRNSVNLKLKGLLEEEKEDELESVKNAKDFYKSCINEDLIEKVNTTGLISLLDELQGWPLLGCAEGGRWSQSRYDFQSLIVTLQKYNNIPLISNWVGLDDKNNSKNVIFVDQIWLAMGSISFYVDDSHKAKKKAYRELIYNTAVLLGSTADDLDQQVDDVVAFETELAKIIVPASKRRNWNEIYTPMTIAELQKNFTNPDKFPNVKFDWLSFLNEVQEKLDNPVNLTENEIIVQQGLEYYTGLFPLLNSTQPKTIANYLVWRIVKNRLRNLPIRFRNEELKYYKAMYGSQSSPPRWKSCVRYMKSPFKLILGRLFVEKYFPKESKTEVSNMIKQILTAFKDMVDELDWMDEEMKDVAKEKADYIVEVIGYPDDILDDDHFNEKHSELQMKKDAYLENILKILQMDARKSVSDLRQINDLSDRRIWYTSPVTVNAYYNQQRNMITFPAGILQPPYFHVDHPKYLNYGGIGFMIGHEITHGFDDAGRQYDKIGNLNDWWQPEAADLYKKKGECFISQYGNFVDILAGRKLNSERNQGENIADNGGIKQTFRAYKTLVETKGLDDKLLPGLGYNQDKLFFINFGQLQCALARPEDALSHILNGAHSPNRFRIIGSLQNMPEFSDVFNCSIGSYMNPVDKCAVW